MAEITYTTVAAAIKAQALAGRYFDLRIMQNLYNYNDIDLDGYGRGVPFPRPHSDGRDLQQPRRIIEMLQRFAYTLRPLPHNGLLNRPPSEEELYLIYEMAPTVSEPDAVATLREAWATLGDRMRLQFDVQYAWWRYHRMLDSAISGERFIVPAAPPLPPIPAGLTLAGDKLTPKRAAAADAWVAAYQANHS